MSSYLIFSLEKPIDSHWFKISCFSCSAFSCVCCFFLKKMKLYKDICSAWISRTSTEFFFSSQIDVSSDVSKRPKNKIDLVLFYREHFYGFWESVLLSNLTSFPLQHEYYFWHRRSKCYEKAVKFYPEIFEFNVFVRSNNWDNRVDLAAQYVWCHYCAFILLLLISEYLQKSKWVDTQATNT